MCFTVSTMRKPEVAQEDIVVYKALEEGLNSPYYSYTWKVEKVEEEEYFHNKEYREWDSVDRGFHSLNSIEDAQNFIREEPLSEVEIYVFVIPKGALYLKNNTQHVSNKLYLKSAEPLEN